MSCVFFLFQNIDGSPLVLDGTLIGIGSKSEGCLNGQPDVFVNVYRNRDFVKRAMAPDLLADTVS